MWSWLLIAALGFIFTAFLLPMIHKWREEKKRKKQENFVPRRRQSRFQGRKRIETKDGTKIEVAEQCYQGAPCQHRVWINDEPTGTMKSAATIVRLCEKHGAKAPLHFQRWKEQLQFKGRQ